MPVQSGSLVASQLASPKPVPGPFSPPPAIYSFRRHALASAQLPETLKAVLPGNICTHCFNPPFLAQGVIFDTTDGGLPIRTNGLTAVSITPAVSVPRILSLRPDPQPGVCPGLKQALLGMRVGGKRTASFPAALGFGDQVWLARALHEATAGRETASPGHRRRRLHCLRYCCLRYCFRYGLSVTACARRAAGAALRRSPWLAPCLRLALRGHTSSE